MREAVIVSTARTPIGKAYRGAFNDTTSPTWRPSRSPPRSNEQASTARRSTT